MPDAFTPTSLGKSMSFDDSQSTDSKDDAGFQYDRPPTPLAKLEETQKKPDSSKTIIKLPVIKSRRRARGEREKETIAVSGLGDCSMESQRIVNEFCCDLK